MVRLSETLDTLCSEQRESAYQSALLSTPLLLLRILASLSRFPSWLQTFFTFTLVGPLLYMAYVYPVALFSEPNIFSISASKLTVTPRNADFPIISYQ